MIKILPTEKKIDKTNSKLIAELVDCHSYYVQQLAQQSWLRTDVICIREIIDIQGSNITFLDPLYKYWLEKYYFKM